MARRRAWHVGCHCQRSPVYPREAVSTQDWINLIACVGELAVAALVALRALSGPLATPLMFVSVDFFLWNFAQIAFRRSGLIGWHLLDMVASPIATALAFDFLMRFIGRARELRWTTRAAYLYYGALSFTAALGWFLPGARRFTLSAGWSWAWLAGLPPISVAALGLLLVHLRRVGTVEERSRTRLLLSAVLVISPLASTELWADLGYPVPRLGAVGILSFTAILMLAALRFRLFDRSLTPSNVLSATVLGSVGGIAYLTVFRLAGTNTALLVLGTVTVTIILLAASRLVVGAIIARRDHTVRLVTLGKMAAQMAHDLKNPLAAMKGACQFLREERAQGRSIDDRTDFLDLLVSQIDRLEGALDKYQRLRDVQPTLAPLQLNELVGGLVALRGVDGGTGVNIRADLAVELPLCHADRDLMAGAIENLLQNALESHPRDATVTVRTSLSSARQTRGIMLSVEDTGAGMSARVRERALDDFFTTKETGTGLGLPFVRRVAEAHGGEISLISKEGAGTVVRLFIPLESGQS
jgi:two-component system sensor histidine kinase HydH